MVCYYLQIGNLGENGSPSFLCEHDTFLDEEIGLFCKLCREVVTEIKYITQLVVSKVSCRSCKITWLIFLFWSWLVNF